MTPHALLDHSDSGALWPASADRSAWPDLGAAYRAALAVRGLRIARGELPRGYKVGFTNRNIWARYAVYAPIWGTVWNTTLSFADDDGTAAIPLERLCQPRLEPEAVFGLRATPRAGAGLVDLFDALDWVAPGFELVQSHRPDWKFSAPETVADGGLHGRLVVGGKVPIAAIAADAGALDEVLADARVALHRNGVRVEAGSGANVLDGPLRALLHFVTELRECPGAPDLQPGDVVTTGTWTDAWPVAPGERWRAEFSAPLAHLELAFR
jgi:2-keto-4-pentenoate hydratase